MRSGPTRMRMRFVFVSLRSRGQNWAIPRFSKSISSSRLRDDKESKELKGLLFPLKHAYSNT